MLYVKSLEIENVKCFGKKQVIDFTDSEGRIAQWTVILGENGTGKTSILRSVVSLLPTPQTVRIGKVGDQLDIDIFIRKGKIWEINRHDGKELSKLELIIVECEQEFGDHKAESKLKYELDSSNLPNYMRDSGSFFEFGKLSPVFCFGYGASRRMAPQSLNWKGAEQTSESLFKDDALLPNTSDYLLSLDYEVAKEHASQLEFERVKNLILKVLPSGVQDLRIERKGRMDREVQAKTHYGWVDLNELSLGYKTTIAWLIDFAANMIYFHEGSENPFEEPAILVIDEIDLHMHPSWQREIMENLSKLFPATQFIVTAHSPLIVQAALDANLVLLKRKGDEVRVVNEPNVVNTWRIDQVLVSDLFGLKDSRPPAIEKKMARRERLLKKEKLNAKERNELASLNAQAYELPLGDTQSEMDAFSVLRDFAAKLERSKSPKKDDSD